MKSLERLANYLLYVTNELIRIESSDLPTNKDRVPVGSHFLSRIVAPIKVRFDEMGAPGLSSRLLYMRHSSVTGIYNI